MNALLLIVGGIIFFNLTIGNALKISGVASRFSITGIKKSGWFSPYSIENGKRVSTMPGGKTGKSGVYFIRLKSSGKVVYVGSSVNNLKDTMTRHFRVWQDTGRSDWRGFDKTYFSNWQNYEVRVIECGPVQAGKVEKYFIRKYRPEGNPIKYENLTSAEVRQIEKAGDSVNDSNEQTPW